MNTELRELILKLIEKNSRLAIHDLAVMLDVAETEVANEIADMEKEHIICGYHTLINWDNTSKDQLTAMIEVKVTPQRGQGFDRIAERIYNFPEVKAVYLWHERSRNQSACPGRAQRYPRTGSLPRPDPCLPC